MGPSIRHGTKGNDVSQGSEAALSIQETNKLRESLGLKPLSMEPSVETNEARNQLTQKRKRDEEDSKKAEELAERVVSARERRRQQDVLSVTKRLGGADPEIDDIDAWVQRNRSTKPKIAEPLIDAASGHQVDIEVSLSNAKIRHPADDLEEGSTMILTLEDQPLLNDKGDLNEDDEIVLENILSRENKDRVKAYRAANKAKPLWEEDGKKKSLLDKYDEEEEELMALNAIEGNMEKKKEDIRAKLAALPTAPKAAADYFTPEEMASLDDGHMKQKEKKKKNKKRERNLKKKVLTADDIDALEQEALGFNGAEGNLGSREEREARHAQKAAAMTVEEASRQARFDLALEKANYASLALRSSDDGPLCDDEDQNFYASLNKARQLASQRSLKPKEEDLAQELLNRRKEAETKVSQVAVGQSGGLIFSNLSELTRTIKAGDRVAFKAEEEDQIKSEPMEEDIPEAHQNIPAKLAPPSSIPPPASVKGEDEEKGKSVVGERLVGSGLGGILGLLQDRGELNQPVEWGGRTNDSKKVALIGLDDVFTGGRQTDKVALDVEAALTKRDEFGRILTPKEAFRQLCYSFHGIQPSKNTKEKRLKQVEKEISQKKVASGAAQTSSLAAVKVAQVAASTPFVVLSGTVRPGQSRDAHMAAAMQGNARPNKTKGKQRDSANAKNNSKTRKS